MQALKHFGSRAISVWSFIGLGMFVLVEIALLAGCGSSKDNVNSIAQAKQAPTLHSGDPAFASPPSDSKIVDNATSSDSNDFPRPSSFAIDAGVVFADRPAYQCVRLSRFGIMESESVISVKSSCDCVKPAIVEFYEANAEVSRALRIDFVPEPVSSSFGPVSANLLVELTFELDGASTKAASIKFLHATTVKDTEEAAYETRK